MLSRANVLLPFRNILTRNTSSISSFRFNINPPQSPFKQIPRTQGPGSPESPPKVPDLRHAKSTQSASKDDFLFFNPDESEPPISDESPMSERLEAARKILQRKKFDPRSFWEQPVAWGDQDPFRHLNNAKYLRYFESARIKWMLALGEEIGGPSRAQAMMAGKGISLILKSLQIEFRKPVTFPDTLVIGYKLYSPVEKTDSMFNVAGAAYSLTQREIVARTIEVLSWYDYDKLQKCLPEKKAIEVLQKGPPT